MLHDNGCYGDTETKIDTQVLNFIPHKWVLFRAIHMFMASFMKHNVNCSMFTAVVMEYPVLHHHAMIEKNGTKTFWIRSKILNRMMYGAKLLHKNRVLG